MKTKIILISLLICSVVLNIVLLMHKKAVKSDENTLQAIEIKSLTNFITNNIIKKEEVIKFINLSTTYFNELNQYRTNSFIIENKANGFRVRLVDRYIDIMNQRDENYIFIEYVARLPPFKQGGEVSYYKRLGNLLVGGGIGIFEDSITAGIGVGISF